MYYVIFPEPHSFKDKWPRAHFSWLPAQLAEATFAPCTSPQWECLPMSFVVWHEMQRKAQYCTMWGSRLIAVSWWTYLQFHLWVYGITIVNNGVVKQLFTFGGPKIVAEYHANRPIFPKRCRSCHVKCSHSQNVSGQCSKNLSEHLQYVKIHLLNIMCLIRLDHFGGTQLSDKPNSPTHPHFYAAISTSSTKTLNASTLR